MGKVIKYLFYLILLIVIYLVGKGVYEGNINQNTTVGSVIKQVDEGGRELAQKAEKEGFESFLAEIDFLEEYNGVKCYVQERVDEGGSGGYYTSKPLLSEGSYSEAYEIGFGESVLNDLCQYYGIEKTLSFIEFCVDNYINDIHEYNYGFNGDMPIIFDYSGFGQKALESRS